MQHDPLQVLNLPPDYTLEQLKRHYRHLLLQLHPDKTSLPKETAEELFGILVHSFKILFEALQNPENGADHATLRATSRRQQQVSRQPGPSSGTEFDVAKFNAFFEQHRMADPNDRGYADWMSKVSPEEAGVRQARQNRTGTRAQPTRKDLVLAADPEPIGSTRAIPCSELGVDSVRDFGREAELGAGAGTRSLGYTDYKTAHFRANRLIEAEAVFAATSAHRDFASLEALEVARAAPGLTIPTDDEARLRAAAAARRAKRDAARQAAQAERDDAIARHHEKVSAMLLPSSVTALLKLTM